ncbi:enoyl-hydratase [Xylariaceae sp. FL0662B]|nr:enoyl-hydratase [Xylariaceae sp. FL0662B]
MAAPSYTSLPPSITAPPPSVLHTLISFPSPHILLVTLNRAEQLNAIPRPQHFALERLWTWYDAEPSLRCAVITGAGRAFCAGADLKEWDRVQSGGGVPSSPHAAAAPADNDSEDAPRRNRRFPRGGFGGLSNRGGLKPVIAAVNGLCWVAMWKENMLRTPMGDTVGGGMEMVLNCDLVIASPRAAFGLPEVKIGVIALAGALPRLVRSVGRQRAMEMALAGRRYSAADMRTWGLVNEVVEHDGDVLERALDWAREIADNGPDAVVVTREGVKLGWEAVGPEVATDLLIDGWFARIDGGENMVEGVRSFVERRKPVWKDSKL